MIPLKVPCPQPIHRIGAVSAGGTHKGKNTHIDWPTVAKIELPNWIIIDGFRMFQKVIGMHEPASVANRIARQPVKQFDSGKSWNYNLYFEAVWPVAGIKSCPILSKRCPKVATAVFVKK